MPNFVELRQYPSGCKDKASCFISLVHNTYCQKINGLCESMCLHLYTAINRISIQNVHCLIFYPCDKKEIFN